MLHNRYRQPGGEDLSAKAEVDNLRAHGVEVIDQQFDNDVSTGSGAAGNLRLALGSAWSRRSHREVLQLCEKHRPDVAHVQNFWMKLSPSVHDACHAAGVPTVQALRNFRLLCANALFLRRSEVCEDCLGKLPWRGVVRRCYRNSAAASAAVSQMIWFNRRRGTWERDVDALIASTEHSRSKFIAGNLPADRIFVKPNFVDDPGQPREPTILVGEYPLRRPTVSGEGAGVAVGSLGRGGSFASWPVAGCRRRAGEGQAREEGCRVRPLPFPGEVSGAKTNRGCP